MRASRSFLADQRGSIAIMTAVTLVVVIIITAFAVDLGSLYHERRQLQGAVDLAAIAAANDIGNATDAARSTLTANGIADLSSLAVELGNYTPDASLPAARRFQVNVVPFNAARVSLDQSGALYFARPFTMQSIQLGAVGTAATRSLANYSIGSRLLALRGGVVNAVLGKLLGTNVTLSVMDYNALASADIQLLSFMDALATRAQLTGVTYNDVLDSSASMGNVLKAAADVASANGNAPAANILLNLARSANVSGTVPLKSMIDLGPYADLQTGDPSPGLDATMSAMDLLSGAATLANGKHQVTVDLTAQIPGLLALTADIAIGEPMKNSGWVAVDQAGSRLSTAQTRLRLLLKIGGSGVLAGLTVQLPLYIELATANTSLDNVACTDPANPVVTIGAQPGIAQLWIGQTPSDLTDWSVEPAVTSAAIVSAPLVSVKAKSYVEIGNQRPTPLMFDKGDIDAAVLKRAETSDFTQSLISTLLGDMQVQVTAGGLNIGLNQSVTQAVASQLGAIAAPLDGVIHSTLDALGVHVGEVDVVVRGANCTPGVLTN